MPEKLNVAGAAPAPDFLTAAELGPVDELLRARLERLRAQIMFASGRGRDDRSRLWTRRTLRRTALHRRRDVQRIGHRLPAA
jgi:hypothetical protein